MRVSAIAVGLGLGLAGCSPDIQSGAYFCGPNAACPDGLACDGATNTCLTPGEVVPFTCTEGPALTAPGCGPESHATTGCVQPADGRSVRSMYTAAGCPVHVEVMISYPVAFMPLATTARNQEGTVIATSAPCQTVHGGLTDACLDFAASASTGYTIEVTAAPGADDCGGACAYNRYTMAVHVLKP